MLSGVMETGAGTAPVSPIWPGTGAAVGIPVGTPVCAPTMPAAVVAAVRPVACATTGGTADVAEETSFGTLGILGTSGCLGIESSLSDGALGTGISGSSASMPCDGFAAPAIVASRIETPDRACSAEPRLGSFCGTSGRGTFEPAASPSRRLDDDEPRLLWRDRNGMLEKKPELRVPSKLKRLLLRRELRRLVLSLGAADAESSERLGRVDGSASVASVLSIAVGSAVADGCDSAGDDAALLSAVGGATSSVSGRTCDSDEGATGSGTGTGSGLGGTAVVLGCTSATGTAGEAAETGAVTAAVVVLLDGAAFAAAVACRPGR